MGMGYQGYAQFYANDGSTALFLATGASVNLVLEPIYNNSVWGAGWYNAGSSSHYANNAIRYEGSIDFDLQGSAKLWNVVEEWGISQRAYPKSLIISPDGAHVYKYTRDCSTVKNILKTGCFCQSVDMSTSEGSFVTCSINVVALTREESDPDDNDPPDYCEYSYIRQVTGVHGTAGSTTAFAATNPLNCSNNDIDPIPYWRTNSNLYIGAVGAGYTPFTTPNTPFQTDIETVEWSVSIANNTVVLYTCNGDREPTAVLQGAIDGSGNATFYHEEGVYDPITGDGSGSYTLSAPYLYACDDVFRVAITRAGLSTVYIEMPAVVVEGDDYGLKGQSDVTNRAFTLKGMGGRIPTGGNVLPPIIMSDDSGALPTPGAPGGTCTLPACP